MLFYGNSCRYVPTGVLFAWPFVGWVSVSGRTSGLRGVRGRLLLRTIAELFGWLAEQLGQSPSIGA